MQNRQQEAAKETQQETPKGAAKGIQQETVKEQLQDDNIITVNSETSLGSIDGVPLEIAIVVGRISMPVREFTKIHAGYFLKFDKKIGDLVEISINGKTIAFGELIVRENELYVKVIEMM